jgi:hypothetical protein
MEYPWFQCLSWQHIGIDGGRVFIFGRSAVAVFMDEPAPTVVISGFFF